MEIVVVLPIELAVQAFGFLVCTTFLSGQRKIKREKKIKQDFTFFLGKQDFTKLQPRHHQCQ